MEPGVQSAKFTRAAHEKESIRSETTSDGRYIPHSGGLMGWFENSGVLKRELPNNYLFHTVIDAQSVRRKLFGRWGGGEDVNRRITERFHASRQVSIKLVWGDNSVEATTRDYSTHGLRLQLAGEEDPGLKKGDEIHVHILDSPGAGEPLFDVGAHVMWVTSGGRKRSVWTMGLAFGEIQYEVREQLKAHFRGA
jgi:hypothetical protein